MDSQVLLGSINNIALLLLIFIVYTMMPLERYVKRLSTKLLIGISVGLIGITLMFSHFELAPGIYLDTRSILLSISGVFLGFIPTLLGMAMTAAYRIAEGGSGLTAGLIIIFSSGSIGLLYRYLRMKNVSGSFRRIIELYGVGVVVHIGFMLATLTLPESHRMEVIRNVIIPVMVFYPIGNALYGYLFYREHDKNEMNSKLKTSEKRLEFLSFHDHLTGLLNRRYFELVLKHFDIEENYPLCIMMGDVNGLKIINDSFGHEVGDRLLKTVSEILKDNCTQDGLLARIGGDEFIMILPLFDEEESEKLIDKVKKKANEVELENVKISVSFGFAIKYDEDDDIDNIIKTAEDNMYRRKLIEGPSIRRETINAIIATLYEKDQYSEEHSQRVSDLCVAIGKKVGLPSSDLSDLRTVGLLHDIGKTAIPTAILQKVGDLDDTEWEEIRKHPETGYRILSSVQDMGDILEYIIAHHERWDGTGYPRGLKGEEIPIQSRILSIADAFDAMTSERSYRSKMSYEDAIKELIENSGSQFDPNLVEVCIDGVLEL